MLQSIRLRGVKRFRDVQLSFLGTSKEVSRIVLLMGPSGSGKTTLLQAIAVAAPLHPEKIARCDWVVKLPDQRDSSKHSIIEAVFDKQPVYVKTDGRHSICRTGEHTPLVCGYGSFRRLPVIKGVYLPCEQATENLQALFPCRTGHMIDPVSLRFADHFSKKTDWNLYGKLLNKVVQQMGIFPDLAEIQLGGAHGSYHRFRFKDGVTLYASELPDSYQSTLCWVADLVGQLMFSGQRNMRKATAVVLIEQIEQHLDPFQQSVILQGIRKAFPCVQFFLSTGSASIAAQLLQGSDLLLEMCVDPETGDIQVSHATV
jgi:energy-coupling factor transporter ATP-binding protein EcfA2